MRSASIGTNKAEDGKRITTASAVGQKGKLKLRDAATDRERLTIKAGGFAEMPYSLFFSTDGHRLTLRPAEEPGYQVSEMTWEATPRTEK